MCDIKEGFKLCTCNEVDEAKTHWKLLRFEEGAPMIMGEVMEDYYGQLQKYDWVKSELNLKKLF